MKHMHTILCSFVVVVYLNMIVTQLIILTFKTSLDLPKTIYKMCLHPLNSQLVHTMKTYVLWPPALSLSRLRTTTKSLLCLYICTRIAQPITGGSTDRYTDSLPNQLLHLCWEDESQSPNRSWNLIGWKSPESPGNSSSLVWILKNKQESFRLNVSWV